MDNTLMKLITLYREVPTSFVETVIIPQMHTAAEASKLITKEIELETEELVEKKLKARRRRK